MRVEEEEEGEKESRRKLARIWYTRQGNTKGKGCDRDESVSVKTRKSERKGAKIERESVRKRVRKSDRKREERAF